MSPDDNLYRRATTLGGRIVYVAVPVLIVVLLLIALLREIAREG